MLLILLACSESAFRGDLNDAENAGAGDDSATQGSSSDTAQPTYWTLGASLDVTAGLPRASESAVSIELLDADSEVLCTAEIPVESAASKPAPDDAIYAWWSLTLERDEHCDAGVETVLLGIGEMNADVEAAIPAIGHDPAAPGLHGAYFGPDSATQWAFGIAWLQDGLASGEEIEGPPVPDGTWRVEPLYPFPI
jgi:hypothetical protein